MLYKQFNTSKTYTIQTIQFVMKVLFTIIVGIATHLQHSVDAFLKVRRLWDQDSVSFALSAE